MPALHRSRLHQLNATHLVRKPAFRGIKRTRGVVPKWTANIRDPRLGRMGYSVHLGTHRSAETAAMAYDLALIALGWEPFNFTLQHYRDTFPEEALRQSLRAVAARLGNPSPPRPRQW